MSASAVSGSRCAVGSSRTRSGASARSARASTSLWRGRLRALGPPRRRECRRPRGASTPTSRGAHDASALSTSASLAAGPSEPDVLPDAGGEEVRVLAGDGDRLPDVLLPVLPQVSTGQRDAPFLGIEKAEEEVDDRRLARAARADEGDLSPGLEPKLAASRTSGSSAPYRADTPSSASARSCRRRRRGAPGPARQAHGPCTSSTVVPRPASSKAPWRPGRGVRPPRTTPARAARAPRPGRGRGRPRRVPRRRRPGRRRWSRR